jgi:hypothetical protein
MALDQLFRPDLLVPLIIFSTPVALFWIKKHYAALEKSQQTPQLKAAEERLALVEHENKDLRARVENLESIVCMLDAPAPAKPLEAHKSPSQLPAAKPDSSKSG